MENNTTTPNPAKPHVLFVGNPGTGKSTLLNSLVGRAVFKAGPSCGSSLTSTLQWYEHINYNYCDTLGLSDVSKMKQAAREIVEALKVGGLYKLVFVCTVESGRFRPGDVVTIQVVLDTIMIQTFHTPL